MLQIIGWPATFWSLGNSVSVFTIFRQKSVLWVLLLRRITNPWNAYEKTGKDWARPTHFRIGDRANLLGVAPSLNTYPCRKWFSADRTASTPQRSAASLYFCELRCGLRIQWYGLAVDCSFTRKTATQKGEFWIRKVAKVFRYERQQGCFMPSFVNERTVFRWLISVWCGMNCRHLTSEVLETCWIVLWF